MSIRNNLSMAFFAMMIAGCGGASDTFEPFGPVLELKMDVADTELRVDILPWKHADDKTPEDWINDERDKTRAKHKVLSSTVEIKKLRGGRDVWFTLRMLKNKNVSMLYACDYRGKGKHARLAEAYGPAELFKGEGMQSILQDVSDAVKDACKQNPNTAAKAAINREISTKPRKATTKPKYVLHRSKNGYSGDFFVINQNTYALFSDKWAYVNPRVSLDDLDVERSRKVEPDKWRKWRKKGKTYQLKDPNADKVKWKEIDGDVTRVKPSKKNLKLNGYFTYVRTTGSMAFGSSSTWRHYTFDKKGNYSSSTSSFGGSGSMSSVFPEMGSYAHASSCNKDGGSSTFSMLHPVATYGSTQKSDECGDGKAGTYKIRGYTIELKANNGTVQRLPFYNVSKNRIYVGGHGYFLDADD